MNALSLESLGATHARHNPHAGERFNLLPPTVQKRVLSRVIDWGVMNGLEEVCRRRGLSGITLGQLSQADQSTVADSVGSALAPILGSTLKSTTSSLSQQAADVIGPVIEQKLKDYGPIFAVIMGLTAAVFTLLGMGLLGGYLLKKLR